MTIKILTSELQAEFLKDYRLTNPAMESVEVEKYQGDMYDVTITFNKFYDISLIAQSIFSAGISYGLDLKYSSYGTEPERVR